MPKAMRVIRILIIQRMTSSRFSLFAMVSWIVLASTFLSAAAFDGNRRGFLLGCGAGVGVLDVTDDKDAGLHLNLKLGWGINDRLLLYYSGHSGIYGTLLVFAPTAAVTFHPFSGTPGLCFTGGLGMSSAGTWEGGDAGYSPHFLAGLGIEISHHWSFELTAFGSASKEFDTIFALTLNVLGY